LKSPTTETAPAGSRAGSVNVTRTVPPRALSYLDQLPVPSAVLLVTPITRRAW
jgi:hypothetical protein